MNLNAPRVDAGELLSDAEFDKLIAGKFPPRRRRSEVVDFAPTIAVDYARHTSECQEQDDGGDVHRSSRGIGAGIVLGAIIFIIGLGLLPWLLSYIN